MECITSSIKASSDFSWCFLAQIFDTLLIRITITVCLTVICKSISRIGTFLSNLDQRRAPFYGPLKNNGYLRFSIEVSSPNGLIVVDISPFVASSREKQKILVLNLIQIQSNNFLNIRIVPFRFSCYHFAYLCFQLHLELW